MKWRLPNNTLFDTMEATLVASWSNGRLFSESDFTEENLYRSQGGGFFLVGNRINGSASGDSIDRCRQLTTEEILRWCRSRDLEFVLQLHLAETLTEVTP